MKNLMWCGALVFALVGSNAAASDRLQTTERLMKAQGLMTMLEKQLAFGVEEGKKAAGKMMYKVADTTDPGVEYKRKFDLVFSDFVTNLKQSVTHADLVALWDAEYSSQFSEQELKQLLAFYESELGQKHLSANEMAMKKFSVQLRSMRNVKNQKIMEKFIDDITKVAKECQCPKKKSQ